jgi:hypothetical protein
MLIPTRVLAITAAAAVVVVVVVVVSSTISDAMWEEYVQIRGAGSRLSPAIDIAIDISNHNSNSTHRDTPVSVLSGNYYHPSRHWQPGSWTQTPATAS